MKDTTLRKKISEYIIVGDNREALISVYGIADIFNKDINIVKHGISKIIDLCRKNEDDIKIVCGTHETAGLVINKILFGILTNNYNSKHAINAKALIIEAMLNAEAIEIEKRTAEAAGLNEVPQSRLEPLLKAIFFKLKGLEERLDELNDWVKTKGKRELSKEEKIYKNMQLEKIRKKVEFETRKKAAQINNERIYREKDHGLVYAMTHMIKEEGE